MNGLIREQKVMMRLFVLAVWLLVSLITASSFGQIFNKPFRRYVPNTPSFRYDNHGLPLSTQTYPQQTVQSTPRIQEQREFQEKQRRRIERARIRQLEVQQQGQSKTLYPRLVGEFEEQRAIMLSVGDWQPQHYPILGDLVDKTAGHANLLVLYSNEKQLVSVLGFLEKQNRVTSHVKFLQKDLNTIWLRDFGPKIAETQNGKAMSIDFYYEGTRPKDDEFPESWASQTGAELNHVPWTLQGGNLLSNGKGLSIASTRILQDNRVQFRSTRPGVNPIVEQQNYVIRQFKLYCNIKQLVLLEPLQHEATQHVDMFATFLAPDLVVVADVDPRLDPQNSQILNRNAQRLSQIVVDGKPLRVERIRVPPRNEKYWSPYTNILLTDRLVLVPFFQSDPKSYVSQATRLYRRLLPDHHVATIDMTSMSKLEGSLHCLSCNLPLFAKLPKDMLEFDQARAVVATRQNLKDERIAASERPGQLKSGVVVRNEMASRGSAVRRGGDLAGGEKSNSNGVKSQSNSLRYRQAKAAAETYRRDFQIQGGWKIDAYVVGMERGRVRLLRPENRQIEEFDLWSFEKADRDWLTRNEGLIVANGSRVQDFILNFED